MNSKKHDFKSAGLYVHIPFCQTKCRYCGFYSEPIKKHSSQRLISAIITELTEKRGQPALLAPSVVEGSNVEGESFFQTIYIGGGSPSCLPTKQLLRLIGEITSQWPKPEEFTIEVNPGQVNKDILSQLRTAGVTRISIGAQSFASEELTFLGRRHSVADIGRAVRSAKGVGFDNIGLDLIFAIPGSTLKSWKHSLRSAIDLGVRHISAYALTYEEQTPLQKAVETGKVTPVDEETDRQMYEMTIDELEKAGFNQYEISNFAKPGFECKHNLNYWANNPYLGIGPAAGSYWQGKRTLNIADIKKYIDGVEQGKTVTAESETPDNIQVACETAVLNLRRRCGIILDEFKTQTGFDAAKLFAEPIGKYKKLGLIRTTSKRLCLTRKALPIADSVLCDFSTT
ncbi:MAG: radical SAM family heme chaperone HemW [Sedimentisphaerales bacterium]|jgi:oxygen-independent coproporphyrinogen-3 oxidase